MWNAISLVQDLNLCPFPAVTIPPRPPQYVNFFKPFHFLAGDQLVVLIGALHISSWLQEIQSREWEEREQTNNMLGLIQVQEEELCNIAFPCAYID